MHELWPVSDDIEITLEANPTSVEAETFKDFKAAGINRVSLGVQSFRDKELRWFYQEGASIIFPDAWEPYLAHIPAAERGDLVTAYHKRLTSKDHAVQLAAAKIWSGWEGATSKLLPDASFTGHYEEDEFALAFARIEAHYFANKGFFEVDGQLLRDAGKIRHIPGVIVQGRYDVVCPIFSAWAHQPM